MERYRYYAFFGQFAMVMPDVVGDQAKTLNLQDHYKNDIRELINTGNDVIIPIQKGPLSPAECWDAVISILGTTNIRVAIPSNAEAFSLVDLTNLLSHPTPPQKIHLLGLTHANPRFRAKIAKILEYAPGTDVSCDGSRLRAMLGENRRITISQRALQHDIQQIINENSKRDDNEDTDIWGRVSSCLSQQLDKKQCIDVGRALACSDAEIENMIDAGSQGELHSWIEDNIPGFGIYPENDLFEVVLSWESKEEIGYTVKHDGFTSEIDRFFPNGFVFCPVPKGVARVAAVAIHADEHIPHIRAQNNIFTCLPN
jgi:hypothetical protein